MVELEEVCVCVSMCVCEGLRTVAYIPLLGVCVVPTEASTPALPGWHGAL